MNAHGDFRRLQTWILLALGAITLAVFAGVRTHEFVHFDDAANIYANPHVSGVGPEQLRWMFTDTAYARRYMPLGWLCYALNRQCFGLNPHAFHVVNLVLHLANVALLFLLVKRLLLLAARDAAPENQRRPLWCAGLAALFWAVNPLRVEVIAWASPQIYGVVFLLTMVFLLAWLRSQDSALSLGRRRCFRWIAVAAYAASLLTYPLALFAPVALFALEIFPLRRAGLQPADWFGPSARARWLDKAPFLAVAAIVLIVTFAARETADARFRPATLAEFGLFSRAMQAFYIWAYYVWKPWAPYDLSPSYTTLHAFNPWDAVFVLSAVSVVGITVAAARRWRDRPEWLALWACHLALLVPVIGVSEYPHSAYDRYSHLHGTLWAVTLGFVLRACWAEGRRVSLPAVTAGAVSLMFAVLAWQQVPAWRDTIPLYQHIIAHAREHPSRARFDEILGAHYLNAGATNEALASFTNAIVFESRRADRNILNEGVLHRSHVRAGDTLTALGRPNEADAHYALALTAKPGVLSVIFKRVSSLRALGRETDAVRVLEEALKFYPGHPELQRQLDACLAKLRPAGEK